MFKKSLLPLLMLSTVANAEPAKVRETWDTQGHVLNRLTTQDGRVLEEVIYEYDKGGRPSMVKTIKDGKEVVEKTVFGPNGPATVERLVDGKRVSLVTRTWDKGKLVKIQEEDGEKILRITTLEYDLYDNVVSNKVVDASGNVLSELRAEIPRPVVPVELSLEAGTAIQTDVNVTDISLGFKVNREPKVRKFGADPLEVKLEGSYRKTSAGTTPVNDQTQLKFLVSYRQIIPRLGLVMETSATRNPVANMNLDLNLTPIGLRYVLAFPPPMLMIGVIKPTWNFRSVTQSSTSLDASGAEVTTRTDVSTSVVRGTFGLGFMASFGPVQLSNFFEYRPRLLNLGADDGIDFVTGLDQKSVLSDELSLVLPLSTRLALIENVSFMRDMQLQSQAVFDENGVCVSGTTLCDGYTLTSMTSLRYSFSIAK